MPVSPFPPALLAARREAAARAFGLAAGAVLVPAGLPVPVAGTDECHEFRVHPEHFWLTDLENPGVVLAYDPAEGWTLFCPEASEDERVWTGGGPTAADLRRRAGVERAMPLTRLGDWLEARRGRPFAVLGNRDFLDRPEGYGVPDLAARWTQEEPALAMALSEEISALRRVKDSAEIARLRQAAAATAAGHLVAQRLRRPGLTERELANEIVAEFRRHGARRNAFEPIVAGGEHAATLHFSPGDRPLRDGEMVLVDAGAEFGGYMGDVTRTLPAGARFSALQRDLYALVLAVEEAAIARCRPGIEYRDLHLSACVAIARGLVDLGILRGSPESLVERDAHALFFPHGLGHLLGIVAHDAGGYLAGRTRSERFGLRYLRADLPLAEGHVVTIEPGIYFIRPLLTSPVWRETYGDAVDFAKVDRLLDFGGIRIEDDVHVTAEGPEVLTAAAPKRPDDFEA